MYFWLVIKCITAKFFKIIINKYIKIDMKTIITLKVASCSGSVIYFGY